MKHGIEVHLSANIEKYKQGMEASKKIASDSMGYIATIFDKIKAALGGTWDSFKSFFSNMDKTKGKMADVEEKSTSLATKIGIGLVAAFVAVTAVISKFVQKGLEADAALAKMSISSDASASSISRFEAVAARSGMSVTEFGGSMSKFKEKMAEVAASDSTGVFGKLGVDITDSKNALLKTDDVLIAAAKSIAGMSSEAEKYAAASKIGFEGKVQLLEDIAHASTLAASTSDDQAASAVRLGKIWHEILPGGKSMWSEISTFLTASLTPAMTDASLAVLNSRNTIVDAFNQIFGTSSMFPKFGDKIKEWSLDASKWFSKVADSATSATVGIMKFLAEKTGLGDPNAYVKGALPAGFVPPVTALASGKNSAVTKDYIAAYNAEKLSIEEKAEAMMAEARTGESLTEGQKRMIKMAVELRNGNLKWTEDEQNSRSEALRAMDAAEKAANLAKTSRSESAAHAKKETEAYAHLIAAIITKTNENKLEVLVGENATESQKNQIKMEQALAAGKMTTAHASYKVAQARLAEQAASEAILKTAASEKHVMEVILQSTIARNELKDQLESEYALYGKSNDAREIAMVAIKSEAQYQKELTAAREKDKNLSEDAIKQLENERDIRTQVGAATMSQGKALSYANQLREENKKFGIDYILDDKARAAASLAIDADMWQERIKLAGDGTEAQKLLQGEYSAWYKNQLLKPQLDADMKMWNSIESTAHDTFVSIFDSGKKTFDRLRDTLKNGLLDMLYQMTIKKWIFNIGASVTGGGAAGMAQAATGGTSSLISAAGTASSVYNALSNGINETLGNAVTAAGNLFGSQAVSAFGSGLSSAGTAGQAASAYSAAGNTAVAGGLNAGAAAAQYVPVVAVAVASYFAARAIAGQYRVEGIGAALNYLGAAGGLVNRAFGMDDKKSAGTTLSGSFGAGGFSGTSDAAWTQNGGWFRSDKSGVDKTAIDGATAAQFTAGYDALKAASSAFAAALGVDATAIATRSQALSIALTGDQTKDVQAVTDFFAGVGNVIAAELIPNLEEFAKKGELASATLQRLAGDFMATDQFAAVMGKSAAEMFGAVGMASTAARERLIDLSGGIAALGSKAQAFAQSFLTDAEKIAPVIKAVGAAMESIGLAGVTTKNQFKDVVNGLNLATEAGAKQYASLMDLAPAFAQAADYASQLTGALASMSGKDFVSAYLAAGASVRSSLASLGGVVSGLYDKVQSAAAGVKSSQDAISAAYFGAQDAVSAAQQKITDLATQSAQAMSAFSGSIRDFLASVNAGQGGASGLAALKAQLSSTAVLAQGGDKQSQSALIGVAGKLLDSLKSSSGNAVDFAISEARVKATLGRISSGIDAATPASADPMVAAQADLLKAQNRLLEYAALASVTGSNTDRASQIVAGSTTALLAAFNDATATSNSARADYATALMLTSNLALTSTNSLTGLMTGLQSVADAQATFLRARDELATYIINTEIGGKNLDKFAANLVASLGLTGAAADNLKIALTSPGTAATTLATLLGTGATKVSAETTNLATTLGLSGTAADTFKTKLVGTHGALTDIITSLKGTGTEADALAKLLGSATLAANIAALTTNLGLSSTAGATLATNLAKPGTAAGTLATDLTNAGTAVKSLTTLLGAVSYTPPALPPALPPVVTGSAELTSGQKFIAGLYNDILGRIPDAAGMRYWADAMGAGAIDLTSAAAAIAMSAANADGRTNGGAGWTAAQSAIDDTSATAWLRAHGVPGFASGGMFGGGMRIVGENGPELESTGPARIWNASQTRSMLSGGSDNGELLAEMRLMRAEIAGLRDAANKTASNTEKTKNVLVRVTKDGEAMEVA